METSNYQFILNLQFNFLDFFQVYDLSIGRTGEHFNSQDGCPAEEEICGYGSVNGPKCGYHGKCIATLVGDYNCVCRPGYRGMTCDIRK